jgi:lipid-A-disaccharide synthase
LAKKAHQLGIPVVYYVIPQVWAWHRSRIHQLRECVDRSLVVLPFEEPLLRDAGAAVEYVGHPLLDVLILTMDREQVFQKFDLDPGKKLIGLLPGSRKREIDSLLPIMLEAAEKIQAARPDVQFVLPKASSVKREQVDAHLARANVEVKVIESHRYNVRAMCEFALVASGTATLETGLLLCPMAIMYKIAYPTWLIAKMVVKAPYIGLINIVAGDMVVPELIQDQCTAENAAERCLKTLSDPAEIERIQYQLGAVKERLGGGGASRRAAEVVAELCSDSPREPRAKSAPAPRAPVDAGRS